MYTAYVKAVARLESPWNCRIVDDFKDFFDWVDGKWCNINKKVDKKK
jgi:hypothetical protein